MTMDEMETRRSMLAKGPGYVPERGETFTVLPGADPAAAFGKPTDIPAAIATAREMLDGAAFVLFPPLCDGNKTDKTIAITKREVDAIEALWENDQHLAGPEEFVGCRSCVVLKAFAAQMKELS